jgi:hypothetical protein
MNPLRGSSILARANRRAGRLGLSVLGAIVVLAACSAGAQAAPALTFEPFSAGAFNADGTASTQAGSHPFELTTVLKFGTVIDSRVGIEVPDGAIKDTAVELPPGVIGNASATPQCSQHVLNGTPFPSGNCPLGSQVGYADLDVSFFLGRESKRVPVFNMVPPSGEPAQFAFFIVGSLAHIDTKVRSDGDYGVTAAVDNINAAVPVYSVAVHLWGVPADPSHDAVRGGPSPNALKPLLRNPTSCAGPTTTTLRADSWEEPEALVTATSTAPATTGCAAVPFAPVVSVAPDTRRAGAPVGFGIDLRIPQNENPSGLASSDLKDVSMTLPVGVAINPSAANGLASCGDEQLGISSGGEGRCPNASKVGTVEVKTPVLTDPLKGSLFLGSPLEQSSGAAASGRMFRIFLEAEGAGVRIKRIGTVVPDPSTGQLTVTFDNNPQLPFETLHVQLGGGPQAALTTPKACGAYSTHTELTPWARPTEPVAVDSSFTIDENCGQDARFEPTLQAGITNPLAGGSSPFTMTLTRPDGQQDVSSLSLSLPPGLVGKLADVPLCPEAQAAAGTCSAASQIGHVITAAGAGPIPLWVPQAGKTPTAVFLSGPYKGAPFSLSVVVPAEAGPFDLGTVVVRAALLVDPHDAHVSVASDPIPTILDGVPLNVQKINVAVDRPGFIVAPTNCGPMQITGTATSSAGASAALSSRFQIGSCASLKFTPKFSASIVGRASKANGVTLTTKLVSPANQGVQANIAKVKVELPKQLPSRLTTLQKSCTAAQFDSNPAGCPPASFVGHATVHTPLLPVPLTGPAIFVSHGGEAFPSLVMVLQGDNVTVDLVGTTLIRSGITSTTFKTVPDVPFSTFELTFPQGKYSALAVNLPAKAHYSFCKQKLAMPTEFIAQNGAETHTSTPIKVEGCANTLDVVSSLVSKGVASITVKVPAAGRLIAAADGLNGGAARATKPKQSVTVKLALTEKARRVLSKHRGRRLKATVSLHFSPSKGRPLTTTTTVLIG